MKINLYWIAHVGKKEYKLTEEQYQFMREQNSKLGTTFFWFDDFSLSLPHISSMEQKKEIINDLPQLPEMSQVEQIKARKKINEIRANLVKKLGA